MTVHHLFALNWSDGNKQWGAMCQLQVIHYQFSKAHWYTEQADLITVQLYLHNKFLVSLSNDGKVMR